MNYFKLLSVTTFLSIAASHSLSATVYEDAESKAVTNWSIYDNIPAGASIRNIRDNTTNSRVIQLNGAGRANSYMLGAKSGVNAWKNSSEKTLHWSMKINEKYKLYVMLDTKKGSRYLYYSHYTRDKGLVNKKYIHHGLGTSSKDGNWHTYTRDLEADLKKYESDNSILAINGIRIQGSALLDNIELTGAGNPPPPPTPSPTTTPPPHVGTTTINRAVIAQNGTAEEYRGRVSISSSDLELTEDRSKRQSVGVQFTTLNIPKNAIVTNAYIQFIVDEKSSGTSSLMIHGEKANSAKTFSTKMNNISSRLQTNASVAWFPANWNVVGAKGLAQRTSDLTPIVQEIVNQNRWKSGNAMAFIIEGTGKRVAESYNGKGILAPVLHIEYGSDGEEEVDTIAPVITLNGNSTVTVVQNQAYTEQGAVANDNIDGVVYVNISGTVDTAVNGTYTITYEASDESGNSSTLQRTVKVVSAGGNKNVLSVPSDYSTIELAVKNASDGDTIILDPGTYHIAKAIIITQNNLTIASKYHTTGDKSFINRTIVEGTDEKMSEMFDSSDIAGKSENLKFIGLTATKTGKFVIFTHGTKNLVDHCNTKNIKRDSISFDSEAGGTVTYCNIEFSGDDAIDVDSKTKGGFEFAHNTILNSHDDGIEIHLWKDSRGQIVDTMHFNIHHNIIKNSNKDGIQLIDFADNTNRTFDISNNTISNNGHVAIGAIFEKTNHDLPETNFAGTSMKEYVNISNNTFDSNKYHILGGDNMNVKNNKFRNASTAAIKRVKGNSTIQGNSFSGNATDRIDSN